MYSMYSLYVNCIGKDVYYILSRFVENYTYPTCFFSTLWFSATCTCMVYFELYIGIYEKFYVSMDYNMYSFYSKPYTKDITNVNVYYLFCWLSVFYHIPITFLNFVVNDAFLSRNLRVNICIFG